MDVAIIGASGDCGRQIAIQLIATRVLDPADRLQLVGRAEGHSGRVLHGLCVDLADAYAEITPELDVALSPQDVVADVVVMAAGFAGFSPNQSPGKPVGREALASFNAPVFEEYARALAQNGHGREVVLVVSNPVELGVEIFARHLGRHRVIGIGAYQDTLRFRREIAADLGIRRQMVGGFVLGEHGDQMLPLWSSVTLYGHSAQQTAATLAQLRGARRATDFASEISEARGRIMALVSAGQTRQALAAADALPADLRVLIKPFVTHFSGAKTAIATGNVAVDLVRTLLDGRETVVAGQVRLAAGEFPAIETAGAFGVPIVVGSGGWSRVLALELTPEEAVVVAAGARRVAAKLSEWTGGTLS